MIYLDNAATTLHKPQKVVDAVVAALGSLGNAGRGAGAGALSAGRVVYGCREAMARLLGCSRADHIAFVQNATMALNCAINGVVQPGDRVVTTVLEHNSVLRPLNRLAAEQGVEVVHVGADALGRLDMDALVDAVKPGTRAVVCTHASNVTGNVVDIERVAAIAHAVGALCIIDASQTAGCLTIDMEAMGIDVACFTGHKGLMGPQGTGGIAVREGVDVKPWLMGGTGVHSFDESQPLGWPTRLEAGTLNGHGLAGLAAGVEYIEAQGGVEVVGARDHALALRLYEGVRSIPGVMVYGDWSASPVSRAGIVALNVGELASAEVAGLLMDGWGIATRAGAHCAPLMHRAMGTVQQGAVRFSTSWFTTEAEVDTAIKAIREIAVG